MENEINFNNKIVGGMTAQSPIPWQVLVRTSFNGLTGLEPVKRVHLLYKKEIQYGTIFRFAALLAENHK